MFEITDEFLAQAGFGSLPTDKKRANEKRRR